MPKDPVSDDDKALFRAHMNEVTPIKPSKKMISPKITIKKPEKLDRVNSGYVQFTPYHLSNNYPEEVGSETIVSYKKLGISVKQFNDLKHNKLRWEAKLDLHGLQSSDASDALCRFIEEHYALGSRCVLIIHGKGGRTGEAPILKNHVNYWLQQLPLVLAFHSALPRDGGQGALYVLLKRSRRNT